MNCPSDGTTLLMSERNGVEIDYCPECRGVWLDRGELDKIMERAREASGPATPTAPQGTASPQAHAYGRDDYARRGGDRRDYNDRDYDRRDYDRKGYDRRDGYGSGYGRKKKSPFEFLGDLFEG